MFSFFIGGMTWNKLGGIVGQYAYELPAGVDLAGLIRMKVSA